MRIVQNDIEGAPPDIFDCHITIAVLMDGSCWVMRSPEEWRKHFIEYPCLGDNEVRDLPEIATSSVYALHCDLEYDAEIGENGIWYREDFIIRIKDATIILG